MTATVELRMPLGYVEVNGEEMEYLDGGAYVYCHLDSNSCWEIYSAVQRCVSVADTAKKIAKRFGLRNTTIALTITKLFYQVGSWYVKSCAQSGGVNIMRTGSTWGKGLYYLSR